MGPPNEVQPSLSAVVKISKIEAERAATRSADAVAPDSGFMPSLTRAVREVRGPVQNSDFRCASGERHQGEEIKSNNPGIAPGLLVFGERASAGGALYRHPTWVLTAASRSMRSLRASS